MSRQVITERVALFVIVGFCFAYLINPQLVAGFIWDFWTTVFTHWTE